MGKFDVKGNSLLHFIFSSRSDVLPFPGAGYSKHSHAWSICPQIYINLNGYVQATSKKKSIQHPFFSCSACNSVFPFLFTCHTSWFCSVTASSVSTFYSCKWMITLPSHLRRTSSGKALLSLHREFCCEAVSEYFFLSFLSLLHHCFDWMICSELSSGAGLGLVWPSSGFTRNKGKTSYEYFHPCKYLQGWEKIFLFLQINQAEFLSLLVG